MFSKRAAFCRETQAVLTTVPAPEQNQWTPAILEHIDKRVKVVAVSTCHWTNGAYIDLHSIAKACREYNITLVVDATQTLGAMPFSIMEIKPDFLVAAGYKWLLCPYGSGLLYVSEEWRNAKHLEETWLARGNAADFTALTQYPDHYLPGARRFDVGEKCTPSILPGAIAALEQIRIWGIENIAHTISLLNTEIATALESFGFNLPDQTLRCPHMFGVQLSRRYKGNLVMELKKEHIYISQRGNALRFAPHLYVNDHDVERLNKVLRRLLC